jgi:hypothetical protein
MQTKNLPNVSMQDYQISAPRFAYASPYGKAIMDWKEYTVTSPVTRYNKVFDCEIADSLTINEYERDCFVVTGYGRTLARSVTFTQAMQAACNILAAMDGGISVYSLENC